MTLKKDKYYTTLLMPPFSKISLIMWNLHNYYNVNSTQVSCCGRQVGVHMLNVSKVLHLSIDDPLSLDLQKKKLQWVSSSLSQQSSQHLLPLCNGIVDALFFFIVVLVMVLMVPLLMPTSSSQWFCLRSCQHLFPHCDGPIGALFLFTMVLFVPFGCSFALCGGLVSGINCTFFLFAMVLLVVLLMPSSISHQSYWWSY